MSSAIVVGAGPNGLAAAVRLARHGVDVTVLEASGHIGGGTRTSELTVPGVLHDHCSAFHPMGVGSPYLSRLGLERYGLRWRWPEIDCAHPLDSGEAGLLWRSVDDTASGLGPDGEQWRRTFERSANDFDALADDIMRPIAHTPEHPIRLARFGPGALLPASITARRWHSEKARALFGGVAAHAFVPLNRPLSSAIGRTIIAAGHRHGWPVAEGGSRSITDALAMLLEELGGKIHTGTMIRSAAEVPAADVVLLDLAPRAIADIYGDRLPSRVSRAYRRYRHGPGAFKLDLAIEGDVPWTNPDCGRAGTVHLGGSFEEIAETERMIASGRMPERPFTLVGQQYLADPSRASRGINPLWVYAHVPHGYAGDASGAILQQIERFAPGFRDRIVATAVRPTTQLATYNPNYVGGDIITGANTGLQLLARPRVALDPYSIGIPGTFICSAASPPGAGAHGMCGYNAAESALRHLQIDSLEEQRGDRH
ncbi:MAG TPA: NAD(P)/FAD-dependent oxidoreductase [Acidimicrobiales bacterium]|nr:NAD(P)/FAD-dependent oxidoreductase [Acidimicrobiales bacterium]